MIKAYASRTGTRRNLAALRSAGWGLLVSAVGSHRNEGFDDYMIDNGAFTAWTKNEPWQEKPFVDLCEKMGVGCEMVICPDIVMGGIESLRLSESWLKRLELYGKRRLIAVQNGMIPADLDSIVCDSVGVFVGGDTRWKEQTMRTWGEFAKSKNAWCHVGRVNTVRRINLCQDAGIDSFDGSSVTRFACTLPLLDGARRQLHLWG